MKTILTFVGTFALGTLLVSCTASGPPPPPEPRPPCSELLGPGPRKAVVLVMWTKDEACHLKTVPNRLHTCVKDKLEWDTAFIGKCNRYKDGVLVTALKNGVIGDLDVTGGEGRAVGQFRGRPSDCVNRPHCHRQYKVTLTSKSGVLVEDPHIDIW